LLGGDLNVVMPNEDINSGFLAISISNGNPQRELAKRAQGKSVVHIHNEEIRNLRVPLVAALAISSADSPDAGTITSPPLLYTEPSFAST